MTKVYSKPEFKEINLKELNSKISDCACTNSDDNPWQG